MTWTILSALACLALVVKLTFFSDHCRAASKWVYRIPLFGVTVYAAAQLIDLIYPPHEPIGAIKALFHLGLLVGSFVLKPCHLPWNQK
jgi:hypothetical protein